MSELAKRFRCKDRPIYEVLLTWYYGEDNSSATVKTKVDEDTFNNCDLFLYLLSFLASKNRVVVESDEDWIWFDGRSDVIWSMLDRPVVTIDQLINGLKLERVDIVVGGNPTKIEVPDWDGLFADEEDKEQKLSLAVDDWYGTDEFNETNEE